MELSLKNREIRINLKIGYLKVKNHELEFVNYSQDDSLPDITKPQVFDDAFSFIS
jgi:hypothetical protein